MNGTGIRQQVINVTHSYNQKIALEIVVQAKRDFYDMFCALKEEMCIRDSS